MKKLVLLLAVLFSFVGCNINVGEGVPNGEYKYIVQEKYKCPAGYIMWISDINNATSMRRVAVGKYTFETMSPGDTLVFKFNNTDSEE